MREVQRRETDSLASSFLSNYLCIHFNNLTLICVYTDTMLTQRQCLTLFSCWSYSLSKKYLPHTTLTARRLSHVAACMIMHIGGAARLSRRAVDAGGKYFLERLYWQIVDLLDTLIPLVNMKDFKAAFKLLFSDGVSKGFLAVCRTKLR
ncbi:hypothetical protein Y032_0004g2175 [Ancylostoma ceylanicum]|uniref:Uncharacterized protein n=1 Tax=Ancylostoma ceylanicum TaxID=53326 RepID=A0A016VXJ1_9BILA|nr:hypothetical protein Y032_0004g2175 [Ancylostoma ceylanicum]